MYYIAIQQYGTNLSWLGSGVDSTEDSENRQTYKIGLIFRTEVQNHKSFSVSKGRQDSGDVLREISEAETEVLL